MKRSRPVRGAARSWLPRVAAPVAAVALAGLDLAAENRPKAPAPSMGIEHAVSELVLIEVHAVDSHGRPVGGLTIGDFVLRVDGRAATEPIASLEAIDMNTPTPSPGPAAGATATIVAAQPGAQSTPVAAADSASAWPRRTILFFEDAGSMPWNMTAARAAARRLLESSPPGPDQVALASYDDHRGFRVLHDFTADRRALAETLKAGERDTTRFSGLQSMALRRMAMSAQEIQDQAWIMAREDHLHLARAVSAMRMLVEGLASWPGRREIIYMGDGVPENPGAMFGIDDPAYYVGSDLNMLVSSAVAAGVTVNAIQTSGIEAGRGEEKASSLRGNGMAAMTIDTGGLKFASNDLYAALRQVADAAHHFYILGYAPKGPPDGRSHTLTLAVHRPGVTLRYRRAFLRLTPEETRTRLVRAAFVAPELHREIDVDAAVLPGPPAPGERLVDLVIYLPAAQVLFLPRPGGTTAALEVGITAVDDAHVVSVQVARRFDATLGPAILSRGPIGGLDIAARLRLPARPHELTVVVSDVASGRVGATRLGLGAELTATPPDPGPAIYAASESALWIHVDMLDPQNQGAPAASRLGPALRTWYSAGEPALVGFWRGAPEPSSPSRVVIRQGASAVRSASVVRGASTDEDAGGSPQSPLSLSGLEAGDYTLVLDDPDRPGTPAPGAGAGFPFRIVQASSHPGEAP